MPEIHREAILDIGETYGLELAVKESSAAQRGHQGVLYEIRTLNTAIPAGVDIVDHDPHGPLHRFEIEITREIEELAVNATIIEET